MDQGIFYYTRCYKKIFSILSDVFPILNFLLLVFKKFTRIVKLTFAKKANSELLFENVQTSKVYPKKKIFNGDYKNNKKEKDILSINIRRNNGFFNESTKQNYHNSILNFNEDSKIIAANKILNIKEFNTLDKRQSFLELDKNNNTQSRSQLNDVNLLGILNMKQLKRKYTVIGGKRGNKGLNYLNLESESNNMNIIQNKTKIKDLFPIYYYFMDIFIDKLINPKKFCCINKKYLIVYKFMGQLFDITSHILLIKNFNIFKNIFFNELNGGKKLNSYTIDKKININDDNLMDEINDYMNAKHLGIFTNTLLV